MRPKCEQAALFLLSAGGKLGVAWGIGDIVTTLEEERENTQ
jgi:hypothetical protein